MIPDDPYTTPARPDGTVVLVNCSDGPHWRPGRFSFRRLNNGAWMAPRSLDDDDLDVRDQRAVGGLIETAAGWRLWCAGCGRDERFDRGRLMTVLDGFAAVSVDTVSLGTLASAYQRVR